MTAECGCKQGETDFREDGERHARSASKIWDVHPKRGTKSDRMQVLVQGKVADSRFQQARRCVWIDAEHLVHPSTKMDDQRALNTRTCATVAQISAD